MAWSWPYFILMMVWSWQNHDTIMALQPCFSNPSCVLFGKSSISRKYKPPSNLSWEYVYWWGCLLIGSQILNAEKCFLFQTKISMLHGCSGKILDAFCLNFPSFIKKLANMLRYNMWKFHISSSTISIKIEVLNETLRPDTFQQKKSKKSIF